MMVVFKVIKLRHEQVTKLYINARIIQWPHSGYIPVNLEFRYSFYCLTRGVKRYLKYIIFGRSHFLSLHTYFFPSYNFLLSLLDTVILERHSDTSVQFYSYDFKQMVQTLETRYVFVSRIFISSQTLFIYSTKSYYSRNKETGEISFNLPQKHDRT